MTKVINKLRFFLPALLWALVIFTFSSFPTGTASQFYWQDFVIKKFAHMVEYAILTVLIYRGLWNSGVARPQAFLYAILLSVFYGITDEVHQSFTPGREPRARDVIFDTIGSGIAVYILWKLLPEAPPRLKRWAEDFQLI